MKEDPLQGISAGNTKTKHPDPLARLPMTATDLKDYRARISVLEAEIAEARSVVQVIDDILSRQEREWLHNKEAVLFLRQYKQKWGI